jgi:hypothetical protein
MKAQFIKGILTFWLVINLFGCQPDGACDDSSFLTTDLVDKLVDQNGFEEEFWMDARVHAYTFVLNQDKILCGIGYQSVKNVDYFIELKNQNDSILFSEIMEFKHRKMEYKSVGNITLHAKDTFIISRKANSGTTTASDLIGPVCRSISKSRIIFPIEHGPLKIIGISYDSSSKPTTSFPIIDLEVNN